MSEIFNDYFVIDNQTNAHIINDYFDKQYMSYVDDHIKKTEKTDSQINSSSDNVDLLSDKLSNNIDSLSDKLFDKFSNNINLLSDKFSDDINLLSDDINLLSDKMNIIINNANMSNELSKKIIEQNEKIINIFECHIIDLKNSLNKKENEIEELKHMMKEKDNKLTVFEKMKNDFTIDNLIKTGVFKQNLNSEIDDFKQQYNLIRRRMPFTFNSLLSKDYFSQISDHMCNNSTNNLSNKNQTNHIKKN